MTKSSSFTAKYSEKKSGVDNGERERERERKREFIRISNKQEAN